jgi:hypothetical protein
MHSCSLLADLEKVICTEEIFARLPLDSDSAVDFPPAMLTSSHLGGEWLPGLALFSNGTNYQYIKTAGPPSFVLHQRAIPPCRSYASTAETTIIPAVETTPSVSTSQCQEAKISGTSASSANASRSTDIQSVWTGGAHIHVGSGNYNLTVDEPNAPGQANWKWCNRCYGLAYSGNGAGV